MEIFSTELSDIEVLDVINQIIEVKPFSVCICGGETLVRKDLVLKIVGKLNAANIKSSMVTNGMYLNDDFTKLLKERGINNVQISLDGKRVAHNRLRNNEKAYEGAIRGLKLLKKYGILSGIAFSPTKWNISDFVNVYSIAEDMNVNEVRLHKI